MAEQPVERQTPTEPDEDANRETIAAVYARAMPPAHRARVVVLADLLPAVSVASTAALSGLPLAWIWSRIAPAIPGALDSAGHPTPLPAPYSYHRFDDLAIFMLMGLAAGLATGIALWMLRSRRGPTIMLAGVLGSAIAAWLAMRTGVSFAAGLHTLSTAPKPGMVFDIAPRLETSWVLLAQPLGCAVTYGLLAAWNGMNDLGRRFS